MNSLRRIFRTGSGVPRDAEALSLDQMRRDLKQARTNSDFPLRDLRPVLLPSPILAMGTWVGPSHYFDSLPVSLTWAFLRPHGTMLYLSHDVASALDQKGIGWRLEARDALTREFRIRPWTHEFKGPSGAVEAVALMHDDGLGPSRLICAPQLLAFFPTGFAFFVPESSCALLLATAASVVVVSKVEQVVKECFAAADVPMATSGFGHEALNAA